MTDSRVPSEIEIEINQFNAVGITEGFIECNDKEIIIKAWQYLIDTGLAFQLQGWFGRVAVSLINEGICKEKSFDKKSLSNLDED